MALRRARITYWDIFYFQGKSDRSGTMSSRARKVKGEEAGFSEQESHITACQETAVGFEPSNDKHKRQIDNRADSWTYRLADAQLIDVNKVLFYTVNQSMIILR